MIQQSEPPRLWVSLARRLQQAWSGPADLPPHLRMEQRFIAVRYLGLLVVSPILPLLNLSTGRMLAAYAVLALFTVYNMGVQLLLRRRSRRLDHGYVTTMGDGFFTILLVMIGGGFHTSFYLMLFATTVAAAMRYGYGPSLLTVGMYVLFDAMTVVFNAGTMSGSQGDFFFRSGFLFLTSLLAGYLREQAHAAETALARQLEGARALNESTRALSSSLDLNTVVRSVTVEARRLVNAEDAALKLGPKLGGVTEYDVASGVHLSEAKIASRRGLLDRLLGGAQKDGDAPLREGLERGETADGHQFIVVPLHARSGVSGQIAVMRSRHAPPFERADDELLTSFIERAALAIENASLYKTIGDRSRDLTRAYADLAAAHQELLGIDNMKTNFIANVSHELRTPLTSIRSFSELLLSYEVDDNTEREFLGIINTESERLTRLINDVLDITKIEAGQIDWRIESRSLTEILQQSGRIFGSLIEAKGITFRLEPIEEDVWVWVDFDRVLQVLSNLLGNALKFTTRGEIALSAEIGASDVTISVSDTGIGIDRKYHESIFEKFNQVGDTLTDKPKGTGLGLCICRDIVQHHGGEMWVDSTVGEGSIFSFTLPLAEAPSPSEEKLEEPVEVY